MRFLGIDYGSRRVGVAVSDEEGRIAFPDCVFDNGVSLVEDIASLCSERNVKKIVVGESLDLSGKPNAIMSDIEKFAHALGARTGLPVFFEPEFFTSVQARKASGEHVVDASAAAIILQSFLDAENEKSAA